MSKIFGAPRRLLALAALGSAAFLFLTWLGIATPGERPFEGQVRLTRENNLAAWWSGTLLALAGLYALEARARLRASDPGAAMGWGAFGCVLLFLSADEIGSLHEELAMVSEALGLGTWTLILLLGAALGATVAFGILRLFRAGLDDRRSLFLLLAGFGILATVPLQEYVEHAVDWGDEATRLATRAAIEEGTELVGMLCLLAVAALRFGPRVKRPFSWVAARSGTLIAAVLMAAPVAVGMTFLYEDIVIHGNPAAWLAGIAWLLAAAVFVNAADAAGPDRAVALSALALLAGLASAASVAVDVAEGVSIAGVEVGKRALVFAVLVAGMAGAWLRLGDRMAATVAAAVAAIYLIAPGGLLTDLAMPLGLSVLTLAFAGMQPDPLAVPGCRDSRLSAQRVR